jgi:nicotinate-nucleotide adenylyltransferase
MRIGYFGGSFDPPHRGHLAVARAAVAAFGLDKVLLVPTGSQPLKPGGATASYEDRLAMVAVMCAAVGAGVVLEASGLEAPAADGAPNYTVDTLRRLRDGLGAGDVVFVIVGADAFLDLRRWRSPEQLLELAEWIVVSRPGFALARLDELGLTPEQRGRVHLLESLAETTSATAVRAALRDGDGCGDLLVPSVAEYIHSHHLYGT